MNPVAPVTKLAIRALPLLGLPSKWAPLATRLVERRFPLRPGPVDRAGTVP